MRQFKTEIKWNKPIEQIVDEATGGESTLLFMANEAERLMNPYVPARNMILSGNVRTYVEGKKGIVHYLSPHARYQFNGILMVSRITGSPWARYGESKVTTGRSLRHSRARHAFATSHWDKAMKVARMGDFIRAVQAYVKGRR